MQYPFVIFLEMPFNVQMVQCKKVNEVFVIGSWSFARGAGSQSYNEFVRSRNGVNFIGRNFAKL